MTRHAAAPMRPPSVSTLRSDVDILVTDRVEGNKFGRVRPPVCPSVSILTFEQHDL